MTELVFVVAFKLGLLLELLPRLFNRLEKLPVNDGDENELTEDGPDTEVGVEALADLTNGPNMKQLSTTGGSIDGRPDELSELNELRLLIIEFDACKNSLKPRFFSKKRCPLSIKDLIFTMLVLG